MANLIQIWKSKGKILEGITNSIFTKDHVEEIAELRQLICDGCPHKSKTGIPTCTICGCVLHLKTRSLSSSCDDSRWHAELTQQEEDALNFKLNPDDSNIHSREA